MSENRTASATLEAETPVAPTIWGLSPLQIHDRFWAARGVQVVRQGEPSEIVDRAELFLLTDPRSLVLFRLRELVETLSWVQPRLLVLRLNEEREMGYREAVVAEDGGRLVRFERIYDVTDSRLARVGLTTEPSLAREWQNADSPRDAWRLFRRRLTVESRVVRTLPGRIYDIQRPDEVMACLRSLIETWKRPDATIPRAQRWSGRVWGDAAAESELAAEFLGPAWVGTGRTLPEKEIVVGPTVLWDDPESRPEAESVRWQELEPLDNIAPSATVRPPPLFRRFAKRLFDIAFASVALALTLPLYPFIILAILLEDGWPVFFAHRRETIGGREFGCLKFRSMRKDADRIKAELTEGNRADGPQFFMEQDPRATRVGRFLRNTQLDELPQFLNVLLGHMAVVGPRPSPHAENQFCPAWREARLSVRPGLTGLWQVRRTREEGRDFQEWIRYDLEYVERQSWALDFWIIGRTIGILLFGRR